MEEIIIDINVRDDKCENCSRFSHCNNNELLCISKFQQLKQECEELKQQVEYLQKFNIEQNEAYTFMNNLNWNNEDLEKVKLKQVLQKIKERLITVSSLEPQSTRILKLDIENIISEVEE